MDSVNYSGTRREYFPVGSGTASMLCTVPEQLPESIFAESSRLLFCSFYSGSTSNVAA